jgi:hypothetical protein
MLSSRTYTILVIILLVGYFLIHTQKTDADLVAERVVTDNRFTATTLSFSSRHTANNTTLETFFNTNGFLPNGFDVKGVRIKKEGKLNFKYKVRAVKTSGSDLLCGALELTVMQEWQKKYEGPLLNFSQDSIIDSEVPEDWVFFLSLNEKSLDLKNKSCQFELVFKTYRTDPESRAGFFAERKLTNSITSGSW